MAARGFFDELADAHNEVMDALNLGNISSWATESGVIQGIKDFVAAVDWQSEPFFLWLIGFHCAVFAIVIWVCTRATERGMMLLCGMLFLLVYSTSHLNEYGTAHFEFFFPVTKTNYFDKQGIFLSALYAAPLVLWCFLIQCKLFFMVCGLLVKVKRAQFVQEKRKMKNPQADSRPQTSTASGKGKKH